MNKSVRRYMLMDLLVLTAIGCLLEGLVTKFIGLVLGDAVPTITFSLLIVFIGVCRWNLWGLLPIPLLAFFTILGGHFSDLSYIAKFYDFSNWRLYLSIVIGLSGVGLNCIVFRNHKTNRIIQNIWLLILIVLVDYVIYCGLQYLSYELFSIGVDPNTRTYTYEIINSETKLKEAKTIYLDYYVSGFNGFAYNLFGLAVAIIGTLVFRSQGVINNAVDKLVEDKKAKEAEIEFLKSFGNETKESKQASLANDESNIKEKNEDSSK